MLGELNQKKVIGSAVAATSAIGGGMLSNGLISLTPLKTEKYKMIVRAALATAGIVGAAAVKPKAKNAAALQSFFAGMSITQALTLVKDWSEGMSFVKQGSEKATDKFIAGVFGLGCGNCGGGYQSTNNNNYMALSMPDLDTVSARLKNYGVDNGNRSVPSFK